jgi:hypothetical protein
LFLVAIWQDHGVVLGTEVGLHTLAVGTTTRVDVFARLVATNKRNRLDFRGITDKVYSVLYAHKVN